MLAESFSARTATLPHGSYLSDASDHPLWLEADSEEEAEQAAEALELHTCIGALAVGQLPPLSPRSAQDEQLADWLCAAAAGDGDAFARFYDATVTRARTHARRLLRAPDIEDLLSEAFFEAWRNASRFDPLRGSALTWMLCIVRSRSLDKLRSNRVHPSVGNTDLLQLLDPPDPRPGPLEIALHAQQHRYVHVAIAQLSARERWLFGLAYIQDLTHSEIAATTGLPLGTVKSHLRRLLRKVSAVVAPELSSPAPTARTARSDTPSVRAP